MYSSYIKKYFKAGGAKIDYTEAFDIPENVINEVINDEKNKFVMDKQKYSNVPIIDDNVLKDGTNEIKKGTKNYKQCILTLDETNGNKLIEQINKNIKNIKSIVSAEASKIKKELDTANNGCKNIILSVDKNLEPTEYFDDVERKLHTAKKRSIEATNIYISNINKLNNVYQEFKRGEHPTKYEDEIKKMIEKNVYNKSVDKSKDVVQKFEKIHGKYNDGEEKNCEVLSVNLKKGVIRIMVGENVSKEVGFKNLCIIEQTTKQKPTRSPPPVPNQ